MKMLSSIYLTRKHILCLLLGFMCSVFFAQSMIVSALHPTTNQPEPDMDIYSAARKWEEEKGAEYLNDWMKWFSKKLDKALKKDAQLYKFFEQWYCDGCDSVVSEELDAALVEYLGSVPSLTKNTAYEYSSVVKPHLDKSIKSLNTNDIRALNTLMNIMVDSIVVQIKEQMNAFRDISTMWLYYDGDTDNSPYDLMADVKKKDSKYFNETPDFWPYSNTRFADIGGLISGHSSPTGTWWGSGNILWEIASALWIPMAIGKEKSVAAVGCTNGSCSKDSVAIAFPTNSSQAPTPHSGKKTFQSIYESWNDWITKYGANRNNSCKVAPTWFFLQWLFDPNISLAKLFSSGIYPVQEVPDLIKWFMDRETRTDESEKQQVNDALMWSFKKRWMNFERPTEILVAGMQRDVNAMSRWNADKNVALSATNDSIERGQVEYQRYLASLWAGLEGSSVNKHNIDSMKHVNTAFEEIASRARSGNNFSKTLDTISDYFGSKGDCQTA